MRISLLLQIFIAVPIAIALMSVLLRLRLYYHLKHFTRWDWAVATETGQAPHLIQELRNRMHRCLEHYDEINTAALVDYTLAQERLWGLSLEQVEYLTRVTPNLLIAIGLLGTFLGITINVYSIMNNLATLDISGLQAAGSNQAVTVIQDLIEQFRDPLRGMAIAFVSSLASLSLGILLTSVNSVWNTTLVRRHFFTAVELYLDHELANENRNPTGRLIKSIDHNFNIFLQNFSQTVTDAIERPLERELANLRKMHSQNVELAERIFSRIDNASGNLVTGANVFQTAVRALEESRFAETFSTATEQLAQFIDQLVAAGARSHQLNAAVIELNEKVSQTLETVNRTQIDFEQIATHLGTTTATFTHIHDITLELLSHIERVNQQVASKSTELAQVAENLREVVAIANASQKTLAQNHAELLSLLRTVEHVSTNVSEHLLRGNEALHQVRLAVNEFSANVSNVITENQQNHQQLLNIFHLHDTHLKQMGEAAAQIANAATQMDYQYKSLTEQFRTLRADFENYRRHRSMTDSDRQSQIKALDTRMEELVHHAAALMVDQLTQLHNQAQHSCQSMTRTAQSLEQINRNLVTLSQQLPTPVLTSPET
ncbi:hypothetical protein RYO59_001360 [Thermosynechococcaceae cyanobacterium Okahandja]